MENIFNYEEFKKLCQKFNDNAFQKDVTIKLLKESYFLKLKNSINHDRRGEVVFCVIRPNGNIIVVTCEEYPKGIFRIPTGGIGYEEEIEEGLYREVKEELGLEVIIRDFLGVLKIKFEYKNEKPLLFYSYLFILAEVGGNLLEDSVDDEISEIMEVDLNGLDRVVSLLRNIKDINADWEDWGNFRAVTSGEIYENIII